MNFHEIITILGIACPLFYCLGDYNGQRSKDYVVTAFLIGIGALISAGVAITIRVLG